MGYLKVKNWEEFQHYKDRNPPWIKLHRTLLDDYEFSRLQDASKAHLMLIWLFASQKDGLVPNDPAFLKKKLGLEKEPNLDFFVKQKLLIPGQGASEVLAESKQLATREETEKRQRQKGFVVPSWVPEEPWKAWLEVRTKKKIPNTDRALQLAVNDLDKLRGDGCDPREVLDMATLKGWRGLFPVNSAPQPKVDL